MDNKGINSLVTKSVVPLALAFCSYTPTSNAVGMSDFVTPTLVGRKKGTSMIKTAAWIVKKNIDVCFKRLL